MSAAPFTNAAAVSTYAEDALRKVPGLGDLHRMATLLLGEHATGQGHILVVGAGGGLELAAMAAARPDWRFTGVDPAPAMLDLARKAVAPFADRVELVEGTIDAAGAGPFDGATCLLVLHFLDRDERLRTLREVRSRLRPGARLVIAHHAPPAEHRPLWMARSVLFGDRQGNDRQRAETSAATMIERLPLLDAAEEESLLAEAGYRDIALIYAALSFRGWVVTA
ncbi:tRNA (cmo5U34)-methyltransferase [Devosia enhydra]|uniref:tRNA (Cmo5U34)-methyltransferase n=1 Tax=Devosia enhydra TaxID=665118 RepID=A0A1K2I1R3_9HYPH|nr:class I SAM-dependent methyltransferase [Devosia enhydra]SFZ86155.1 tRNA (cmo5U34)-methyltransferase [Devosia enhydra]